MNKKKYIIFCALALICTGCGGEKVSNAISVDAAPEIFPDYTGVTVPVNIAPLNFGSRRGDGLHTVPYIAHIAADGTPGKPFMLPQRNPRSFYADRYRSFNIPEFIAAPVDLDSRALSNKLNSTDRRQFSADQIQ